LVPNLKKPFLLKGAFTGATLGALSAFGLNLFRKWEEGSSSLIPSINSAVLGDAFFGGLIGCLGLGYLYSKTSWAKRDVARAYEKQLKDI